MKTATITLFTLAMMIALSSAARMRKVSLKADAEIQLATTAQTVLEPFGGTVSVGNALPSISLGNQVGDFGTNDFTLAFWFVTSGSSSLTDIIGKSSTRKQR